MCIHLKSQEAEGFILCLDLCHSTTGGLHTSSSLWEL